VRLLIIDPFGESVLDWALRCKADQHQVKWFIGDRKSMSGKGLVETIDDWRPWMHWADVVFLTDNVKYLVELDHWRKKGIKIVGPNVEGARWELDRTYGMKVLEKHGIEVPTYREFKSYQDAIRYVKKEDRPFVSKPCGEETDKSLSYVAKTPEALVSKLEGWEKAGKLKGSFILQEKIDGICEMGVGGWFGPGGFNAAIEEDWEYKKLMPGNLGQNTGEMGTVQRFVKKSKLFKMVVEPLTETLDRIGYLGCLNVNCLIDSKGKPWPLEFTNRPGWPAFNIQQALTIGDHLEWMYDLALGHDSRALKLDTIAVGVLMALPPFPNPGVKKDEVEGVPIYGIKPSIREHLHPCQIMAGEAPQRVGDKIATLPCWVTAGDYVLIATGTGDTVREARRKVYRVLDNLKATPGDPFWRIDIGQDLKKGLPAIQPFGFATGMNY